MNQAANISFSVIEEKDISPELDRAIREELVVCFPAEREYFSRQSWWRSVPAYRVIGKIDNTLIVTHVAIVDRTAIVGPGSSKVNVAGIQSVSVLPDYRGKGFSDKAMAISMDEAKKRGFDAGLLFCLPQLEKVYVRMGWAKIEALVYKIDDKKGKIPKSGEDIVMFYPFNMKEFPAGDIDLAGPDW